MGDAEDAQWNAFQLYEKTRHLLTVIGHLVMRGLQNMHFTRDETSYLETKKQVISKWSRKLELAMFLTYFNKQWLTELHDDIVYVFQKDTIRVFDPELNRTREAIPVTAQLSNHTGLMRDRIQEGDENGSTIADLEENAGKQSKLLKDQFTTGMH
ncbi:hypothetical protein PHMEG_0002602 [Phytophthora megakarya]|uniref:Uncharacterized protein n=1 Tax=Phytophthora megakarya TaxID=4795 RepID=A0A225X099_9STRA|nr:hypothetical protein PHMEG_0002602 [Phytophthora megakarya]